VSQKCVLSYHLINSNNISPIPVLFGTNSTEFMPPKGDLNSHFTCLVYVPYLGKL